MQLVIFELELCHFVVYSPYDSLIVDTVVFDEQVWADMVATLVKFYRTVVMSDMFSAK